MTHLERQVVAKSLIGMEWQPMLTNNKLICAAFDGRSISAAAIAIITMLEAKD